MPTRSLYPKGHIPSELERINFVSEGTARPIIEKHVIPNLTPPEPGTGTGVVMAAGGSVYLRFAYASISLLRRLNPEIPLQIWYLGPAEIPTQHQLKKFDPLNVSWVDARAVMEKHFFPYYHPWNAKINAICHCPFQHVLLLDADCAPVIDPQRAFDTKEYQDSGAMFFPDLYAHRKGMRTISMMALRTVPNEHESGQLLIDRNRHWKELELTKWMNRHKIFYDLELGDKNLYSLAFTKLGTPYTEAPKPDWMGWGMAHRLPDGTHFTNHEMSPKRSNIPSTDDVLSLYKEFDS